MNELVNFEFQKLELEIFRHIFDKPITIGDIKGYSVNDIVRRSIGYNNRPLSMRGLTTKGTMLFIDNEQGFEVKSNVQLDTLKCMILYKLFELNNLNKDTDFILDNGRDLKKVNEYLDKNISCLNNLEYSYDFNTDILTTVEESSTVYISGLVPNIKFNNIIVDVKTFNTCSIKADKIKILLHDDYEEVKFKQKHKITSRNFNIYQDGVTVNCEIIYGSELKIDDIDFFLLNKLEKLNDLYKTLEKSYGNIDLSKYCVLN